MELKIKKLSPEAVIPSQGNGDDVGYDLTAISRSKYEDDSYEYGTGLAISIPKGYGGFIFPRSSIRKYALSLSNCVGVIDPGYTGEVSFTFKVIGEYPVIYNVGDRIGQLVVIKTESLTFKEVDDLDESERGSNGFGSTGN